MKMLQEGFDKGALESKFEWGGDFGAPDETYLSSQFDRPVMVHHYPGLLRRFTWRAIRSGRNWRWESMCWRRRVVW